MDATELRQSSSSGDHVEVEPSASARSRAGWCLPLNSTASILAYCLLQRSGFYLVSPLASSRVRCLVRYPLPLLLTENLTCCCSEYRVYISRAQHSYFWRPCYLVFFTFPPKLQPLFLEHPTMQQHVVAISCSSPQAQIAVRRIPNFTSFFAKSPWPVKNCVT